MPSQAFFEFMNQTMLKLTRLLGSQDKSLKLSCYTGQQTLGQRICLDRQAKNGNSVVLSWEDRMGKSVQPCVLAWFAMRAVSRLLLDTCDISFEADSQWFPDDLGQGYHTPETLSEYLYEDTCRQVEQAYEVITQFRFRLMNRLADMTYESEPLKGKLAFFPDEALGDSSLEPGHFFVRFASNCTIPWEEKNLKQIRKLLAGAGTKALCFIYGQNGYICQGYLKEGASAFPVCVSFEGGSWKLLLHGCPLFQVCAHQLKVIDDPIQQVCSALENEFGSTSFNASEYIPALRAIRGQLHGSSLIFLDLSQKFSQEWMDILVGRGRALPIEGLHILETEGNPKLDSKGLTELGRMDGAFVVDVYSGCISYLSTIVDGLAIVDGLPDAGARRNSIYTWVANLIFSFLPFCEGGISVVDSPKVVAVTFSEDGNMDIFQGKSLLSSEENCPMLYPHPLLREPMHTN